MRCVNSQLETGPGTGESEAVLAVERLAVAAPEEIAHALTA